MSLESTPKAGPHAIPAVVKHFGFWSALLTTTWIMAFNIAVIAGAMGAPTRLISVGASLLIAPSFLVLTASLHSIVQEDKKMWTLIGFAFAIVYTTLAGFNYFLQLTVVRQNPPAYG